MLAASLTAAAFARAALAEGEKLKVETTLHVLASIAKDVGGDLVEAEALARSTEDPHEVTSTPTRMLKLRDADVFAESGYQLEIWDENLLDGARNPKIRKNTDGFCFAGNGRPMLEVPAQLSRAGGDLHPFGNPHIWYEPFVGHIYAKNIEATFAKLRPDQAETFTKNRKAFDKKLDEAIFGKELCEIMGGGARLEKLQHEGKLDEFLGQHKYKDKPLVDYLGGLMKKAKPLKGTKLIAYHQSWAYFAEAYGCEFVGYLEPKPGIPPTPGHLQELEATAKRTGAKAILVMSYENKSTADDFATRIGAKSVAMPSDVGADETKDWFEFQEKLVDRVVEALPKS
jgi:ABC-type Zn uptake system ZnuABC Zn-binding protein ZnuA